MFTKISYLLYFAKEKLQEGHQLVRPTSNLFNENKNDLITTGIWYWDRKKAKTPKYFQANNPKPEMKLRMLLIINITKCSCILLNFYFTG